MRVIKWLVDMTALAMMWIVLGACVLGFIIGWHATVQWLSSIIERSVG